MVRSKLRHLLYGVALCLLAPLSQAGDLDSTLVRLSELILQGEFDKATPLAQEAVTRYPGSRAVQLLAADLANVSAGRLVSMDPSVSFSPALLEILNELKKRRHHAQHRPPAGTLPDVLVQPAPQTQHIIAVDLHAARLYLLARDDEGHFHLSEDHYISIGLGGSGKRREGDLRTPVGIYDIDGFKPDRKLPELYGSGAFTLAFPNHYDRQRGIDGSGIWLHGMPHDQLSRPPQDSEGCVVMRNDLLEHLYALIEPQTTPVILAEQLNWVPQGTVPVPDTAPWRDDPAVPAGPLAYNGTGLNALAGLVDKGGEPALEIYRYPTNVNNTETQLFRVRILQRLAGAPDKADHATDQYWSLRDDGQTWRRLDTD
ncbi:L,D-transpeptidase family protein [Granulosicoccaceae sp. 1_MG-2023]|nr:L,D-transpeptidase family protein [Granulosicoccaceae sp. 1_MG-2023]